MSFLPPAAMRRVAQQSMTGTLISCRLERHY